MIIADLVRRSCQNFSSNVAVTDPTGSLTYGEVWDRSVRLVNALRSLGVMPGDRVATLGANAVTTLEEMTGLAVGGYARTALHGMNGGETHAYMLAHVEARALIVQADHYARFHEFFESVPSLQHVIVHSGPAGTLDYEQLLKSASAVDAHVPVRGEDIIHLAFSSGSSGKPKPAAHTHESWMHVTTDHVAMLPRLSQADVYLAAAPLTHAASTVLYGLLARGARIQVMPSFDPGEALRLIEQERCSLTVMVPTMLKMLVTHPDVGARDLSSLRAVLYAGAPISVATARAAHAALGDVLFQTYGQSECLPATLLTPEDHALGVSENAALLRSAGRPCLNSRVRILDPDGHDVGPGEIGEIVVHTQGRMREIFNDPELTAARITPDGFVRTKDNGYLDANGYLFVVDRIDDMIISGGFNIWPAEIENLLAEHPAVEEVLVVGVAHDKWGETPHAVVTLRSGATTSEQELIEFCRNRLGSMKKPTAVMLRTDPLPRNAVGKISRREIRQLYWPAPPLEVDRNISGA
jgi:acyl-CoA synthetase (AMP-forming)/AMP-acid ligase II